VLLGDSNPQVRASIREALLEKFKSQEERAELNYTHLPYLLQILNFNKDKDEAAQLIEAGAKEVLWSIAEHIQADGILWLNEHFNELPDTPTQRTFLKKALHQALKKGVIAEVEAQFMFKCIVKRGITANIDPKANKIVLEDSPYTIQATSQDQLMYIVNEVIKSSEDSQAQQYRAHKPLFVNSGSALPIATADVQEACSIVDGKELNSENWYVSVLHLSDHHKKEPKKTFLLLEQRNYAGEHVIHQITLDKHSFKVISHAVNPLGVGDIREAIFGKMGYVDTKPRYYGSSFTISQESGEKLLKESKTQTTPLTNSYKSIHALAASHVEPSNSNSLPSADLLGLTWSKYIKKPDVVEYKKDKLLQVDAAAIRRLSLEIDRNEQIQADADAKSNLDFMSTKVPGVDKDYENPIDWFKQAAEKGNAMAQNCLGNKYKYGHGVDQDYEKAVFWYQKAANQRNAMAQNNLGDRYKNGEGVTKDYKEAVKWYQKAAERGSAKAAFNLGDMYYNGYGVEQDYEEAVDWYEKAAEDGNAEDKFKLGNMYYNGEGVDQDYKEAAKWYEKAAEQGHKEAKRKLDSMNKNVYGVETAKTE
jgi:TPR repeat protein